MLRILTFSFCLILMCLDARAQWTPQTSGTTVRLRGVSTVSARVAWASGDKGTFLRTTDGGLTWQAGTVPDAGQLDFRDVDAFDAETAYLLSIGEGDKSRIYKTTDGGRTWTLQFRNSRPKAFFDAMAFWDAEHGIAVSDPVEGRFLIITTSDGGRTWSESPSVGMPPALAGEGAFAASGTCITVEGKSRVWFGTGGEQGARIFRSRDGGQTWRVSNVPVVKGKAAGVFSLFFRDARRGVAVGGDYTKEGESAQNVAVSNDGGETWLPAETRPAGYRSAVAPVGRMRAPALLAVGPSGSDYSLDGGRNWLALGTEGFHATSFARNSVAGFAVGEGGRISRFAGRLTDKSVVPPANRPARR